MGAETVTVPTVRRTTDTDTADGITDITINTAANLTETKVNRHIASTFGSYMLFVPYFSRRFPDKVFNKDFNIERGEFL